MNETAVDRENDAIGVVIVAYQAADDLSELIPNLLELKSSISLEIVVVDNDSTDGTAAVLTPCRSAIRYIRNPRNVGFAAAVNTAVEYLNTDYILLLNPDCRIREDVLKGLAEFMKTHPEAGAVAPRIVYPDGRLQPSRGSFPNLIIAAANIFRLKKIMPADENVIRSPLRIFGRIFRQYAPLKPVEQVDYTIGACVLIRRKAFLAVGGMDDRFFLYYEEIDLALRMREHGHVWYFLSDFDVVHESGGASNHAPLNPFFQRYRSMILYFGKHKPGWQTGLVTAMIRLMAAFRLFWGSLFKQHRIDPSSPWDDEKRMLKILAGIGRDLQQT